ncbi:MAG: hypothetical protein JO326_11710, partial [Acetobacteraceae bacterium]|nr:hypothetical protein [Acetobacteraceae bacterium]
HLGFEALLQDAELRRLYDLAPDRMGRLLRPLCPMLAVKPPAWLRRPRRKRTARKPEENRHCERRSRAAIQEHRPKPPEPPPPPPHQALPAGDYRHIFDPMNAAQMAERSRAWAKRQRAEEEFRRRYPGRRLLW